MDKIRHHTYTGTVTPMCFVADVHIGNHKQFGKPTSYPGINSRCAHTLDALAQAGARASSFSGNLAILGDLYDSDHPTPAIYKRVEALSYLSAIRNAIVLKGNHESTSDGSEENSIGVAPSDAIAVDKEVYIKQYVNVSTPIAFMFIPFQAGPAKKWLPKEMEKIEATVGRRVVCFHLGIQDDSTPNYMCNHNDAITVRELKALANRYDITNFVAGNWHNHQEWHINLGKSQLRKVHITQLGALCPTGFNNPGIHGYGGMYCIDAAANSEYWTEIPGVRFVSVDRVSEIPKAIGNLVGHVYLKVKCSTQKYNDTLALCDTLAEKGYILDYKVEVNRKSLEQRSRKVAKTTKSAKTVEQAVANYVNNMPVPDGVDRKAVLGRIKGYL